MRIIFHLDHNAPPTDIVKMNPLPIERRIIQRPAPVDERRIIQRPAPVDERRIIQRSSSIDERSKRIHKRYSQMARRNHIQQLPSIDENKVVEWRRY